jgi:hypothetical protein
MLRRYEATDVAVNAGDAVAHYPPLPARPGCVLSKFRIENGSIARG